MRWYLAFLAWLLVSEAVSQTAGFPEFGESRRVVERLLNPEAFEAVDWNGDGWTDVLVAGNGNNRLALFEGDSTGGFEWMSLFPDATMTDDWHDLKAVDWNGDGRLDLLACEEGGLTWLERLPDSTLAPAVQLRVGDNPIRMDVADVNGDGVLDVAYCDSGTNEAVMMLGDGAGGTTDVLVENVNGATATAIADWSGDGLDDWLYASSNFGQLYVRLGDGMGVFSPPELVADFGKLSAIGVLHGADGEPDAFFLGVDDTYVLQWDPVTAVAATLGLLAKAQQFDFGDLNGDGLTDVVAAAQVSGECGVMYGAQGGGFEPDIVELTVPQAMDVAVMAVEGESRLLSLSRTLGQVRMWTPEAQGSDWAFSTVIEGIQYVRNMASGDLNGDGLDDLAVMVQGPNLFNGGPEYLYVALARAGGEFEVTYVPTGTYFGYEVQLADYDGDADLDAVVSDYNGDRVVGLRNDGQGAFLLADTLLQSINGCDDVAMVDLDGDGDLDIVAAAWQGSDVLLALNDGAGQFGEPLELDDTGSRCEAVAVDDFNNDGLLDVAAAFENSGDVRIWLRTGDVMALDFASPQVLDLTSAQDLQCGDVDGDGDVDLLGVGYNEEDVQVFANDQGVFQAATGLGMEGVDGALMLTVADPDGDGLAEVIVSEYGGARFRLFHGATGNTVALDAFNGPQNAVFGDFDGDGDKDVAMAFYSTGEIRWRETLDGFQPPLCFGVAALLDLLGVYGCAYTPSVNADCADYDFDLNGLVQVDDLLYVLGFFGACGE
ncbi:MAG: FG-GAP repeat domain-containing protein [Flavobacteriales bacterium]